MNKAWIIYIIDRSGSMGHQGLDVTSSKGINDSITAFQSQGGDHLVTLVDFDDVVTTLVDFQPLSSIKADYVLQPRGGTALLDAVGKTLNEIKSRLQFTAKEDLPDLIDITIVTDGEENSSKEYTIDNVKELIQNAKDAGWNITYLSSDLSSIQKVQAKWGLAANNTAYFGNSSKGFASAYTSNAIRTASYLSTGNSADQSWKVTLSVTE